MGVKSTLHVTRAHAVNRLIDAKLAQLRPSLEGYYQDQTNATLEEWLEELNDKEHGGEGGEGGFDNYTITEEK